MTAQISEVLFWNGKEQAMTCCPPLPVNHPRFIQRDLTEMKAEIASVGQDRSQRLDMAIYGSSACWRGYRGTWEIRDNQLFLLKIEGRFQLKGIEPLFADWVTTVIRIGNGEMLQYKHLGFESVYEEDIWFKVEQGNITASRVVDNRGKEWEQVSSEWEQVNKDWDLSGKHKGF